MGESLYLDEKMGLTTRERDLLVTIISGAVCELRDSKDVINHLKENYPDDPIGRERALGYGFGQRNTALNIAGSSLGELFGTLVFYTRTALERLAEREQVDAFCQKIVDDFYEELVKIWNKGMEAEENDKI